MYKKLSIVVIVLLFIASGVAGYFWFHTRNDLRWTQNEMASQKQQLANTVQKLDQIGGNTYQIGNLPYEIYDCDRNEPYILTQASPIVDNKYLFVLSICKNSHTTRMNGFTLKGDKWEYTYGCGSANILCVPDYMRSAANKANLNLNNL